MIELRGPAETGGVSSVGLPPRELTVGRDCDLGNGGRQTFYEKFQLDDSLKENK